MPDPINLTRHLSATIGGSSGAQIFSDSTGQQYVVKYQENGHHIKVLSNEYIASEIAKNLEVFTPEPFIVVIDDLLLPSLKPINGQSISKGPHFGSKRIENLYEGPATRSLIEKCNNIDKYPAIILLDVLLYNTDRRNDGNYLIVIDGNEFKFCAIDHGHCLGMNWDADLLKKYVSLWSGEYLEEMYETITGREDFNDVLSKIDTLDNAFITTLVDSIPEAWLSNSVEIQALKDYLSQKKSTIGNELDTNKIKFTNWI
jgi:hypothetical protein